MNPYQKETKIYNLFEQIKSIPELKDLLKDNKDARYYYNFNFSKKISHLHKCVLRTFHYPFLNNYIIEYLNLYPDKIDIKNEMGDTALMLAVSNCKMKNTIETVKILLKYNPNVNIQNLHGHTALIIAINSTFIKRTSEKIIKMLVDNNADINLATCGGENVVSIAFFNSIKKNGRSVIDFLLPNRKKFIENMSFNKNIIVKNRSVFWKVGLCDFKIIYTPINNFRLIINRM